MAAIKLQTCLLVLAAVWLQAEASFCDSIPSFTSDRELLQLARADPPTSLSPYCIFQLTLSNSFETLQFVTAKAQPSPDLNVTIEAFKESSKVVIDRYDAILSGINERKNKAIVVPPPFTWY